MILDKFLIISQAKYAASCCSARAFQGYNMTVQHFRKKKKYWMNTQSQNSNYHCDLLPCSHKCSSLSLSLFCVVQCIWLNNKIKLMPKPNKNSTKYTSKILKINWKYQLRAVKLFFTQHFSRKLHKLSVTAWHVGQTKHSSSSSSSSSHDLMKWKINIIILI